MKKFLKAIAIGIIALIAIKLLTIAIIMFTMKLREFAVEILEFIVNVYKGIVYPFTSKSKYKYLLSDAKDWDEDFD